MATPLLQKARQRKIIYFGAIVALFTVSLIHREFIVKPQATKLQLRETGRGEVELTSSAVRLMLTGSRGLAVTMLWYTAMDKQKRNEWNELELVVKSITKLQPYFITPWLYQSWNIAFNVAVECDRPRDKYYYVSRGLELLAEGERRNSGSGPKGAVDPDAPVIPGNPELRQFMGFIYQLKIGNSDERLTMRSLLELSCIDPVLRNPNNFWKEDARGGKQVDLVELGKFCQKYPRLVRRIHEQLPGHTKPEHLVKFLEDHQNIPNRFKPIDKSRQANIEQSELKDPVDQFPILPPAELRWPDAQTRDMTEESVDVFLVCRTWYQFAQKPLPPPEENPSVGMPVYDKLRYRVPKGMVLQLFRQYPARAQVYIAEMLEMEGFFDSDGWDATDSFKKWSGRRDLNRADHTYGTDPKYHSRLAWARGYQAYRDFGVDNGIYHSPAQERELNAQADLFRQAHKIQPNVQVANPPAGADEAMQKAFQIHQNLTNARFYRDLANFDTFLDQAEGESDQITITMRKTLFAADRKRKREVPSEPTLELYREVWQLYAHVCFKYPRFAKVSNMQEDMYETHLRALKSGQEVYAEDFKRAAVGAAQLATWNVADGTALFNPALPMLMLHKIEAWNRKEDKRYDPVRAVQDQPEEMLKVTPIRYFYGPLDLIHYYDGAGAKDIKEAFLHKWIQAANYATNMTIPVALAYPNGDPSGREYFLLTRTTRFVEETDNKDGWRPLITPETRRVVQQRLGLPVSP